MLMCNNLLTPYKESNCKKYACQFLTKLREIKALKIKLNKTKKYNSIVDYYDNDVIQIKYSMFICQRSTLIAYLWMSIFHVQ